MGKDKSKKTPKEEGPPPPKPLVTFHLCGTDELQICGVLAAYNLLVSSLPSPSPFSIVPLKSSPVITSMSSRAPKNCGVMMTDSLTSGTALFGLKQCLSGLAPPLASQVESAQISQWMGWCESVLVPAVKKPEKLLEKAVSALSSHLAGSPTGRISDRRPLTVADIYAITTLMPLIPTFKPLSDPAALTSFLSTVPQEPLFSKTFSDSKRFITDPPPSDGLLSILRGIFSSALYATFPEAPTLGISIMVTQTKDPKNGEYQCNNAMELFKKLPKPNAFKAPRDVAVALTSGIKHPLIEKLDVAGPGFINITLSTTFLTDKLKNLVVAGDPRPSKPSTTPRKVVVDFSSPNIAKDMHVGHLRSTIIGESVCRILEYTHHPTDRVNHVGDWGTQFGMLIQYLLETFPKIAEGDMTGVDIKDLTAFYKAAKIKFDEDEIFKKVAQQNVVKLQGGDEQCRKIWQLLCDISRNEFEKVYKRLGVTVTECGESFYNEMIPGVIEELTSLNMVVPDGGAKCIFVPEYRIPLMVQKSDGGFGYDSTDMAAISYRLRKLQAGQVVYITDFTQSDHFMMIFDAAKKAGWWNTTSHKITHIGFGTVCGEDGKRFKTRSGDTVRLVDLLDESVRRMEESLLERNKEGKGSIPEGEIRSTAEKIGYGAIKYFDLSRNPTSNYIFSYDAMLDTRGNTGVYLMFAKARLGSIINKAREAGVDVADLEKAGGLELDLGHVTERSLAIEILKFPDVLENVLEALAPHKVCEYLYNMSLVATSFVTECRIMENGVPNKSRLLLCSIAANVMQACFHLLSIECPDRI
ncbi:hypothetical protein TrVE_jg11447 [Triparma verrucosa]|uniref:arginine--tRNA ligase n=1 Tax=Triparma verrucosa TaxID=1606542 RepID=A0A9W7C437_9STRA|nr:hypothetical protein TrVE_jg11447 [Triparma verrucosa]